MQLSLLSALWALSYTIVPTSNSVMVPTQGEGTALLGNVLNASVVAKNWQCEEEKSFCCEDLSCNCAEPKETEWDMLILHQLNPAMPIQPQSIFVTSSPLIPLSFPSSKKALEGHLQSGRLWKLADPCPFALIDWLTLVSMIIASITAAVFLTFVCIDGELVFYRLAESVKRIPTTIFIACTCFLDDTDSVLMITGEESLGEWDARKYPKCRPFVGQKGVPWENFKRDFGSAMSSLHISGDTDDNDLEQTMLGWDMAGDNQQRQAILDYNARVAQLQQFNPNAPVPPPPMPPDANAMARHRKRNKTLYAHLYAHLADLRLREMLSAMCPRDGRRAFQYLEQQCARQITDLELFAHNKEWEDASITSCIGVKVDSVTMFSRYLNGLNARRPIGSRKSNDELTLKLLSCITNDLSPTLAMEAQKELRNPPHLRQFTIPGTAERDYGAAVQSFDEFWRAQYECGAIRPSPRRGANAHTGRVENAAIADGDDEYDEAFLANSAASRPALSRDELRAEPLCWNCRGFGHVRDKCPSAPALRPIGAVIDMLRGSLRTGGFQKGKGKGKGARMEEFA